MTEQQRIKLLALGIDPDTGRKIRSDKGKERKPYKPRQPKESTNSSAMNTYKRVLGRIKARDQELVRNGEVPLLRGFDENGYFLVIPAAYATKACDYKQLHQGRVISHSVRRVCTQKEIDLEKYRFAALQEMAFSDQANEPVTQLEHVRIMLRERYHLIEREIDACLQRRKITWFELFCELYYLDPMEASLWDYETWLSHYRIAPKETLPDDFVFRIKTPPGTPEFMPEWQYRREKLERQQEEAVQAERERKRAQFLTNMGIRPKDERVSERDLRIEALKNIKARKFGDDSSD